MSENQNPQETPKKRTGARRVATIAAGAALGAAAALLLAPQTGKKSRKKVNDFLGEVKKKIKSAKLPSFNGKTEDLVEA